MIISYSHRFIFFHLYKTAGTSVRKALLPVLYNSRKSYLAQAVTRLNLNGLINNPKYRVWPHHLPVRQAKNELPPEVFDNFFKFAFVRNPWDWQVSLYFYMLRREDHRQHKFIKSLRDFDEYLDWRINKDLHLQKIFLSDEEGNLLVDYVADFGNMHDDFTKICENVGFEANLPHENKSKRKPYQAYYSERTRDMVAEAFQPDIEAFNYRFE